MTQSPNSLRYGQSAILTCLIFFAVVMQHLTIFRISSFEFTIGFLLGIPVLIYLVGARGADNLPKVLLPIVGYLSFVALAEQEYLWPSDFLESLLLVLVSIGSVTLASSGLVVTNLKSLASGLFAALVLISGFSVLQVATGAIGSDVLFNPWGDFQYQYQYQPFVGRVLIPRAAGFFLEPSYNSFVIGSLAVCLILLGKRLSVVIPFALLGIGSSQSATGLILFSGLLIVSAIRARSRAAIFYGFSFLALAFVFQSYLINRVLSINAPGSSGNYRIAAPLEMMRDILLNHPFGLPLGSIFNVVPQYDLVMAGKDVAISLDNGFYVVTYLFGWVGVVAISIMFIVTVAAIVRRKDKSNLSWIAKYWLFFSLLFSGGIYSPEYALMCGLVLASGRIYKVALFPDHVNLKALPKLAKRL